MAQSRRSSRIDMDRSLSPRRSRSLRRSTSRDRDLRRGSRSRSRSRESGYGRSERRYRERSYDGDTRQRHAHQRDEPVGTKVVISDLTQNVLPIHLDEIFGEYGKVVDVEVPLNPKTQMNRGYGYIWFENLSDAEFAVDCMNQGDLDGAIVEVYVDSVSHGSQRQRRAYSASPPPAAPAFASASAAA